MKHEKKSTCRKIIVLFKNIENKIEFYILFKKV